MAAAKAVSKSRENEKRRKSAARTRKWCERQSAERQSEIRHTDLTGHAEGRACLSEERQSDINEDSSTCNWLKVQKFSRQCVDRLVAMLKAIKIDHGESHDVY